MTKEFAMRCLSPLLLVGLLGVCSEALAQSQCPPGAYYCDEEFQEVEETPAPADAAEEPAQPPDSEPSTPETSAPPEGAPPPEGEPPPAAPAPQPPPHIQLHPPQGYVPARDRGPVPPPRRPRWRRWALGVHLGIPLMGDAGDGRHEDAEMGGAGLDFRYRPNRRMALSLSLDFIGGTDFNGFDRQEVIFAPSGILYFNPRDRAQVYMLFGMHFAGADVQIPVADGGLAQREYSYFGGQLGLGLEYRLSRWAAIDTSLVGFVRGRTDDDAHFEPEFIDAATGRATNQSGGGLFRIGGTFYW